MSEEKYTTFKNTLGDTCLQDDRGVTIFIGSAFGATVLKNELNAKLEQIQSQAQEIERLQSFIQEFARANASYLLISDWQTAAKEVLQTAVKTAPNEAEKD